MSASDRGVANRVFWEFSAVPSDALCANRWQWRITCGDRVLASSQMFAYYYDCVADAWKHGYPGRPGTRWGLPNRGFN